MTCRRTLLTLPALAAFALPGLAQAQTGDPSFRLNNRGTVTIEEVYVSSSRDENWGDDLLGDNVLPPGQTFIVRLPADQCINDIRLVFEGGTAVERRRINTCELTDINVPN